MKPACPRCEQRHQIEELSQEYLPTRRISVQWWYCPPCKLAFAVDAAGVVVEAATTA